VIDMPRHYVDGEILDYPVLSGETGVTNKKYPYGNVKRYGAVGDGVADDTTAIKNAVTFVRDNIISSNFKTALQVVFPGGVYKVTSRIISSPFVHFRTEGFVKIESYVTGDSTIHFTAQSTDPTFTTLLDRQQYHRSPLINGINGGMTITSMLDKTNSLAQAIEIGSRTDLGALKPTSRYSMCDVAINNFDIAVQMNEYNNYIGGFDRLHIEGNNTLMRFGSTVKGVVNSGENFHFHGCVFANASTGFEWNLDGMDVNFYGCSFDFIDKVFYLKRGYKRIYVNGGHIEGIGNRDVSLKGIAVSEVPTNDEAATVVLDAPVVFCDFPKQFQGLKMNVNFRSVRWERKNKVLKEEEVWVCGDEIQQVTEENYDYHGPISSISRNLNILSNHSFAFTDVTVGDVTVPSVADTPETPNKTGWIAKSEFMAPTVITSAIPTSPTYTKAMKLTGSSTATNSYVTIDCADFYRVNAGQRILYSVAVNPSAISNGANNILINAKLYYYDEAGNKIGESLDYLDNTGLVANEWQRVAGVARVVPVGCTKIKVRFTFSRINSGITVYATGFHLRRG
jgi:hypothetical protein